jgi:NAD(P)-dependent dehydrogenase (short-subunit alcohol dehydrogenase family)
MSQLDDTVALVTGAASGIGAAVARRFSAEGALVGCLDRDGSGAARIAEELASGHPAVALTADVSDDHQVLVAIERLVERAGRLDTVACIAGIGGYRHSLDVTTDDWHRTLAVNLTGTFIVLREAFPWLLQSQGSAITTGSVSGLRGRAYAAAYCASKAGVVNLTRSLAIEFAGRGVRVNCVCPGAVDTPLAAGFQPPVGADESLLARNLPLLAPHGRPEDVSGAYTFLASAAARFVTGAVLVVDGGAGA